MKEFQETILVPYDASGDLESTKVSIQNGIATVLTMLQKQHPEMNGIEMADLLGDIMLTNWAISAIVANELSSRNGRLSE